MIYCLVELAFCKGQLEHLGFFNSSPLFKPFGILSSPYWVFLNLLIQT